MIQVSVDELRLVLNAVAVAQVSVRDALVLTPVVNKLLQLANQPHPVGALVPQPPEGVPVLGDVS